MCKRNKHLLTAKHKEAYLTYKFYTNLMIHMARAVKEIFKVQKEKKS